MVPDCCTTNNLLSDVGEAMISTGLDNPDAKFSKTIVCGDKLT